MRKHLLAVLILLLTNSVMAQWHALDFFATVPDIIFTPGGTGYASSGYAILKSTNGTTWNVVCETTAEELFLGISFPEENTGYACGLKGKIVKTTDAGATWTTLNSGTTTNLNCIYFVSATTGYAAGDAVILKTTDGGLTWTSKPATSGSVHGLWFKDESYGLAASMGGPILQTQDGGVHWLQIVLTGATKLYGISFPTDNIGYMCGQTDELGPMIIKTTDGGNKWDIQNVPVGHALTDIFFTSETTGYAVGLNCILKTTDGGATWGSQEVPLSQLFNCVCFTDSNHGYIGGAAAIYVTENGGGPIGIEEKAGSLIKVSPNPVSDKVHIDVPGFKGGEITLTSPSGQEVLRVNVSFPADLDLSGLASGSYILKMQNGEKIFSTKIIRK